MEKEKIDPKCYADDECLDFFDKHLSEQLKIQLALFLKDTDKQITERAGFKHDISLRMRFEEKNATETDGIIKEIPGYFLGIFFTEENSTEKPKHYAALLLATDDQRQVKELIEVKIIKQLH